MRPRLGPAGFFLIPALALILVFYVAPLILSVYISFTPLKNWNLDRYLGETSLDNYRALYSLMRFDPDFQKVLKTTVVFTTVTLAVNVLGGLGLALALYFMDERLSLPYRVLWLLPRMTPVAVYSLLWYYFFLGSPEGTLNSILMRLGVIDEPVQWGTDPRLLPEMAWAILVIVNGFVGVSFGMIVFYSALHNIPREQVIAARVDGASTLQLMRYVLIPQIRWHIVYVTVWQLLSLLTTFAHIFLLVEWGVVDRYWGQNLALYVFLKAFSGGESYQGLAAAAATILVVIGVVLGFIALRVMRFREMMVEPKGELG